MSVATRRRLSVTYFVPVVSAVTQRRQTAVHLFGLGATPEQIVMLDALTSAFIAPSDQPPPPPTLEPLRRAGIPTVDDQTFAAALRELTHRRCTLRGFVRNDGWTWEDVILPQQRLSQ